MSLGSGTRSILRFRLSLCQFGTVQKDTQPTIVQQYQQLLTRSFFTSPTLNHPTKKRRKRYPFFWLQDKYHAYYDEKLTPENEQFFQQFLKNKYSLSESKSPLKVEPWSSDETYTEGTRRTGIIGKKLGVMPMWTKDGRRVLTTCLQISDNHVIKYHPPEEFVRLGRAVDVCRYEGLGCIVVGSDSRDPRRFTAEYNGLFEESGVMSKQKLTRFFITHNARLEPGTPLLASHFRPGMHVTVYGKSIEWGRQGVRKRFQMKLGRKTHGATKSHNRVGSIGRGRKWAGPLKGRRMPGHHGGERVHVSGLKICKVDNRNNLIYLKGPCVPGPAGSYINIMDTNIEKKRPTIENPPPFPTTTLEENSKLDYQLLDDEIHSPKSPSIVFEISEQERRAAALALKKFGKAKTAQKIR